LAGVQKEPSVAKNERTTQTARERAQVDLQKPAEVIGWCNKWSVTPERLTGAVAEVGTSALAVAKALGKSL
jgi:hypothetical protein